MQLRGVEEVLTPVKYVLGALGFVGVVSFGAGCSDGSGSVQTPQAPSPAVPGGVGAGGGAARGPLLFTIDQRPRRAAVRQREATVAKDRAQLRQMEAAVAQK